MSAQRGASSPHPSDTAAPTQDVIASLLEIAARRLVAACKRNDSAETEAARLELQNHLAELALNRKEHEETIEKAECEDCGVNLTADSTVGCPDGSEICRACFDAGGH